MASPTNPTRSPTELERIRHVPDWEIPVNPPKRRRSSSNFFSRLLKGPSPHHYSSRFSIPSFFQRKPATAVRPNTPGSCTTAGPISKETGGSPVLPISSPISPTTTTTNPTTLKHRFDNIFPPSRRYCGLSRRIFLIVTTTLFFLIILALGLGLGLGLGRKSKSLPLPWTTSSVQSGELTYFSPSVGVGACGYQSGDNQTVVAVGHQLFDGAAKDKGVGTQNPNRNPLCGLWIRVMRGDGREVEVMVVDRCTGCGVEDLDLSVGAFGEIGEEREGRVKGKWEWVR